jgi:hypothetical protein
MQVGSLFWLKGKRVRTDTGVWNLSEVPVAVERHLSADEYQTVFCRPNDQQRFVRNSGCDFMKVSSDHVLTFRELRRAQNAVAAYSALGPDLVRVCVTCNVRNIGGHTGKIVGLNTEKTRFLVKLGNWGHLFAVLPQDLELICGENDSTG